MPSNEQTLSEKDNKGTNNKDDVTESKSKDDNEEKKEESNNSPVKDADVTEKKENTAIESGEQEEDDEEEEEEEEEEDPLIAQLASKYALQVEEKIQEIEKEEKQIERKELIEKEIHDNSDKAVDLSKLKPRYSAQHKPVLKSILVEYGLPDKEEEVEVVKKKPRKKRQQDYSDSEAESERGHVRVERTDRDKYRLSDYLREEDYMETLEAKIAHQRKEINKRSEDLEKRLQQREKKLLAGNKKKLERVDLTHDSSFLKSIPKSNAYKVITYENKMKAAGKLNRHSEIEQFWLHSKDHEILKNYVKQQGINDAASLKSASPSKETHLEDSFVSSRSSSVSSVDHEKEREKTVDFRPMTQIEETNEMSRPSTRDANASQPWAVTQQFPGKHGKTNLETIRAESPLKPILSVPSSPVKKSQDPYTIAKQAAIELDKKHPMMQLPAMSCFMDLGENTVDPEEVLNQMKAETREKERQLFVKRIRKMYHLAQANTAATQRIMERRDDFVIDQEAAPADTWLSSYLEVDDSQKIPLTEEEKFLQARPWLRYVRHRAIVPIYEESEPPSGFQSQTTSASVTGRSRSKLSRVGSRSSNPSLRDRRPPPLALPVLEQTAKVLEPKCLSTLWTNYLGAGKSVFAK